MAGFLSTPVVHLLLVFYPLLITVQYGKCAENTASVRVNVTKLINKLTFASTSEATKVTLQTLSTEVYDKLQFTTQLFYSMTIVACHNQSQVLQHFLRDRLSRNATTDIIISVPFQQRKIEALFTQCIPSVRELFESVTDQSLENHHRNESPLKIGFAFNLEQTEYFITELLPKLNETFSRLALEQIPSHVNFGVGFNDKLINCDRLLNIIDLTQFAYITIDLGVVVDSYGVFERKINSVHYESLKSIVPAIINRHKSISYYFNLDPREENWQHWKLKEFSQKWASQTDNIALILRPLWLTANNSNISNVNTFKNIPSILDVSVGHYRGRFDLKWDQTTALEAIEEKFNALWLTYDQWKFWASTKENVSSTMGLNLMVDLFYLNPSPQNLAEAEDKLLQNSYASNQVNSVVISMKYDETSDKISKSLQNFSTQMRQKPFKIGCTFQIYRWFSDFQLGRYMKICSKYNGEFFILSILVNFDKANESGFSYSHFVTVIQPILNQAQHARQIIQHEMPRAEVYIRLITQQKELDLEYETTVFCNENILKANEYFEAIGNWAKQNQFPIIFKSALDTIEKPTVSSWMSMLRPILSASAFSGVQPVANTHPLFVMRNYPSIINGWETSPCIMWSNDKQMISPSFFRNSETGAVLTLSLRENDEPVSKEEFQTLFQFILHKFSLVEVVLTNFSEALMAITAMDSDYIKKVSKSLPNHTCTVYINWTMQGNDVTVDNLLKIEHQIKEIISREKLVLIGGIHVSYADILDEANQNTFFMFQQVIILGVVIPNNCLDEIRRSTFKTALEIVSYVVCTDVVDLEYYNTMNSLGKFFDTHLYIKKMVDKIVPEKNVDIFFKLELEIELNLNDTDSMEKYLKVVELCQQFGAAYGIRYFLAKAFERENTVGKRSNGWWTLTNYEDLTNVDAYVEKLAATQGRETWRPTDRFENQRKSREPMTVSLQLVLIIASAVVVPLLMLLTCSILLFCRYKNMQKLYLTTKEVLEFRNGDMLVKWNNGDQEVMTPGCKFNTDFELALIDITIDETKRLGSGQFGTVYLGTVKGVKAAIKSPNSDCDKVAFKNVLREVTVLCHLGSHPHVVGFMGAYVNEIQNGKLHIATELCEKGSLEAYLREKKKTLFRSGVHYVNINGVDEIKTLSPELFKFSLEIARGMEYIAGKNVVHGDLAARNILLDSELACKIGDFGLSRKLYEYKKYTKKSQEPLPWKWMAYESLTQSEFTSMSDMWSYGVTVWEIFSLGDTPFAGLHWTPEFTEDLGNGLRLTAPKFSSPHMFAKLQECWNLDAMMRPTFTAMINFFVGLRSDEYLEVLPI